MKFTEFNLNEKIIKGIKDAGFVECMPVQEMTLEKTLKGQDVFVQSQTGTGKTAAFLITIFNFFLEGSIYRNKKALILVPTRELAVQVENDAKMIGKYCNLKIGSFFGGLGYTKQELLLKDNLNIFIGTPGRLIDFNKSRKIDFSKMDILVIDEADRMFDMGFYPDIRYIVGKMCAPAERLTMLYSATLSDKVKYIAGEYMNNPAEIAIEPEHLTVKSIAQELYHVSREDKFRLLLGLFQKENPKSVLIFTNTKKMAERVSIRLTANGYKNDFISGDIPQKKRLRIIETIKSGKNEILVATDVAARGLHIEGLDLVVNYDLPTYSENYVHRIGRTGRAGKSGKAVSLVCEEFVYGLEDIEKLIGMKIEVMRLDEDALPVDKSKGQHFRDRHEKRDHGRRDHDKRHPERKDREKHARKEVHAPHTPHTPRQESPSGRPDNRHKKNNKRTRKPGEHQHTGHPSQHAPRKDAPRREMERKKDAPSPRVDKDSSMDERIEYYRKKYGENFVYRDSPEGSKPADKTPAPQDAKKEPGVIGKIKSIFRKK
jgi:ATP-dependent RNA helicase RhlB